MYQDVPFWVYIYIEQDDLRDIIILKACKYLNNKKSIEPVFRLQEEKCTTLNIRIAMK